MRSIIYILLFLGGIQGCSVPENNSNFQQIHQGEISAYDFDQYPLQLHKNDKLTISIQPDILDVVIFSPIEQSLENQQSINITSSQTFQIRVLMPRALARRKEVHQYVLSISVERH